MNLVINLLPVVPLRKEPAHTSEMVSQLLFGEYAEVLEKKNQFWKIKCAYDEYEGWVQSCQLTDAKGNISETNNFLMEWHFNIIINNQFVRIPYGIPVYPEDSEFFYPIPDEKIWKASAKKFTEENLEKVFTPYLNTPYFWGGKSVYGIDCSGFAQQVFKLFEIKLLRDAYQQATQGILVEHFTAVKAGDLAFFQNENEKITHVGIILSNNKIVHASGKVRIDIIDEEGIINSDNKIRTHQLHSIKRFF